MNEVISDKPISGTVRASKRYSIFTKEQLKIAKELGICKKTLYQRVKKGIPPDQACSIKNQKKHDWNKEIYALYKADESIADGTIYEIAAKTGKSVQLVKFYTSNAYKKRASENALVMEYLGNEDEYC